ncbi:MAG: hypothetical protein PHX44_01665 [Sulfurimonas sp.]|uniref:hypothetical protein n=1 Tax=Sulfurimonas sp. TaxID=2022749 RepID=UPI00260720E2|nr:hypothetical protein [Sulfurimonas sp.]MDD2651725.1 hypothetical protein [Sulfurimonas sp.]MDD2651742.1 hypothetical protein [Sulfurimonas sp.]MDD3451706.1 hypothetical protein [Sulfurimonas sp.]MDD3451723.1 hypothetical protein [Sulfurimonas sp.]
MPKYRIQLKQGKRTIVEHAEFKSLSHALDFYSTLSTMKVTEILRVEYEDLTENIPIDDMNYNSLFKGFIKNDETRMSKQVLHHNIKLTKSSDDVFAKIKECMDISGLNVDSVYCSLFKK